MTRSLARTFRPAVILYTLKAVTALMIAIPLLVFLNGKFSLSKIADRFWPFPGHEALVEFFWQSREIMYIIVPLVFLVAIMYFVMLQFFSGGIYDYFLASEQRLSSPRYFQSCGQNFRGFIKIALASLPAALATLLAADLVGLFFGRIIALIFGKTIGNFVMILFIIMSLYLFVGYLIVLRIMQAKNKTHLLIATLKSSAVFFKTKLRYFLALNIILGLVTVVILSGSIYIFSFVYKLNFKLPVLFLVLLGQQLIILLGSFLEALQIKVNLRLFDEVNHGTEME